MTRILFFVALVIVCFWLAVVCVKANFTIYWNPDPKLDEQHHERDIIHLNKHGNNYNANSVWHSKTHKRIFYKNVYDEPASFVQPSQAPLHSEMTVVLDRSIIEPRKTQDFAQSELIRNDTRNLFEEECSTDTEVLHRLLSNGYSKHRVPSDDGVRVTVEYWIQEISAISELTSDFEMDMYVNELWYDGNLNFTNLNACKENITLDHANLNKVWMPNNCFITTKYAEIHDSPFKNVFFTLFKNGTVWVNYRVKVRGPCQMDLSNFPFDRQKCTLTYLSFNHDNNAVQVRWNTKRPDPVYPLRQLMLPDFDLIRIEPETKEITYPAGKWDTLTVTFTFKRRFIWYLMQGFVPNYLTIFVSWIAFSLSPRAIPARTLLGVNAILAQIFQFGSMRNLLPRVSYVKAIDVWILGSMAFVFASLVELAIVGYQAKMQDNRKRELEAAVAAASAMDEHQMLYTDTVVVAVPAGGGADCLPPANFVHFLRMQQVDFYAKILFPACYSLFNIFYWYYYGLRDWHT